jgi:4'-phosphopantetheinyl transferase
VSIPEARNIDPAQTGQPSPGGLPAAGTLAVPAGLQVWWAQVDVGRLPDRLRTDLAADLNPATLAKLDRFVRVADRDRGLAAHALLRRLLVAVVGGRPAELVLRTHCPSCGTTEHGKPYLDAGGSPPPVEVNLSHSGQVVAVALAPPGVQVGVDVEGRRPVDWPALRRSVFADQEWAVTEAAPDPDRHRTQAWARKEAAAKASGHGLSLPFSGVVVTDAAWGGWTAALPDQAGAAAGWDVGIGPEVAAAVALHDPDRHGVPSAPTVHQITFG